MAFVDLSRDDGVPLPFATIYVKQTGSGAVSDTRVVMKLACRPGITILFFITWYETQTCARNWYTFQDVPYLGSATAGSTIKGPKKTVSYHHAGRPLQPNTIPNKSMRTPRKFINQGKGQLKRLSLAGQSAGKKEGINHDRVFISESV